MHRDDQLFGARSAIQKGIRRGDLDLVHTSFNLLWSETKHRQWLRWRVTTLVTEEAWHFCGELGKLLDSKTKEEKDWRQFLYRLCLATKNKDAVGLWYYLKFGGEDLEVLGHPEFEEMQFWRALATEEGDESYLSVVDSMVDTYRRKARNLDEYEESALMALHRRTKMGGMMGDRQICLSSMVLLYHRGVNEEEVMADVRANAEKWKEKHGRKHPEEVEIPWYAFDMHTQAGKIALGIFMRRSAEKSRIDRDSFEATWFLLESAKIPKELLRVVKVTDGSTLGALDCAWWVPYVNVRLSQGKKTPKQLVHLWKTKMRDDIKGAVYWILGKRDK